MGYDWVRTTNGKGVNPSKRWELCKFLEVSISKSTPLPLGPLGLVLFFAEPPVYFLDLLDYLPTESHGEKLISGIRLRCHHGPGGNSGNYSVQLVRCPGRDELPDRVGKDLPGSNARVHVIGEASWSPGPSTFASLRLSRSLVRWRVAASGVIIPKTSMTNTAMWFAAEVRVPKCA